MRIRSALVIVTLAALTAAAPADSQPGPCAGFDDIFGGVSSPFCNDVSWLKLRQVTVGCTATSYCPGEPVNRLQMAAFMNRVGNVFTPNISSTEDSGGALDLASNHILCITPDMPARGYAWSVLADAALSYDVTGTVNLEIAVARSVNGGSWTTVSVGPRPKASGNARNHQHVLLHETGYPGSTDVIKYAVSVGRVAPFLSQTITGWTCHLQVVAAPYSQLFAFPDSEVHAFPDFAQ